jgi:hypothetical protein
VAVIRDIYGMGTVLAMHCERCDFPMTGTPDQVGKTFTCPVCRHKQVAINDGCWCETCCPEDSPRLKYQKKLAAQARMKEELMDLRRREVAALEELASRVASPVLVASAAAPAVPSFTCPWCGSQRPQVGRFCPHCRLDLGGTPADGGGFGFLPGS